MTPPDAELLTQFATSRDEAALAHFVQRHLGLVYRAALRQLGGDTHRAEEAAQLVFTRAAQKASTLRQHPSPAGWLYTTTHFVVRELQREERRRLTREQEAFTMQELTKDERHAAEWERVRPLLDAAMQAIGDRDREALIARFFEGRTFPEIGTQLVLSEDAARMRVERGLEKLRRVLSRRGVTSTGAALGLLLAGEATAATVPAGLAASVTGSALAAATGAGAALGPVAVAIHFMSTSKIAAGGAAALLAVLATLTWYEIRREREETAALTAVRLEVFGLARRTEETERQVRAARAAAATATDSTLPAQLAPEPVEKEVNGPFGPSQPGSRARGRALMAAYPEIQRLVTAQKRAYFAAQYRKFYEDLALTPAQIEAFEMLKVAGVSTGYSDFAHLGSITLDAAPVMVPAERTARYRELLGERGYQRLVEFESAPASAHDYRATQLAARLYFTDTPLTAGQASQFTAALRAGNQAGRDQSPADYWAAVRTRAQAFLAPPQLAALGDLQAMDEFNFARQQNQQRRTASAAPAK